MLKNKKIVLGVCGGIAAYKSAEIASRLKKLEADVHCVLTKSAQEFITPLTFRTLSENPVITDLFGETKKWNVEHIALADLAEYFLVAPATANIIGKFANGIADDFLSTCLMATKAKIIFAPAMNVNMYESPAYKENVLKLKARGCLFVEPVEGNLACGYSGKGKMAEPIDIVEFLTGMGKNDLAGLRILVSAGPTREPLDPVRFLTNHSTGKMGYSLAEKAVERGAEVTLISGPTNLPTPVGVKRIDINTTLEMQKAIEQEFAAADIVIKSAAVADYRPKIYAENKIKKTDEDFQLELVRNPDILAELGKIKGNKVLVGFAAETQEIRENAQKKIQKKNLDFIVANDVSEEKSGFGTETNRVNIYFKNGKFLELPLMSKKEVADIILDEALETYMQNKANIQNN